MIWSLLTKLKGARGLKNGSASLSLCFATCLENGKKDFHLPSFPYLSETLNPLTFIIPNREFHPNPYLIPPPPLSMH